MVVTLSEDVLSTNVHSWSQQLKVGLKSLEEAVKNLVNFESF